MDRLVGYNSGPVMSLCLHPTDHRTLASCSMTDHYHTVCIWNLNVVYISHVMYGHTGSVITLAYNHDGSTLASGSTDGTIRLWKKGVKSIIKQHGHRVHSVCFEPKTNYLISASDDCILNIWKHEEGEQIIDQQKPDPAVVVSGSGRG